MGYSVVCGSINMDLVCRGPRIPKPGETILGYEFNTYFGGKGSNQAVALSRLGLQTYMVGCVGNDMYGEQMKSALIADGIYIDYIETVEGSSGTAHIMVEDSGENSIVVIPGANKRVSKEMILKAEAVIMESQYLLAQLEIPIDVVKEFLKMGKNHNIKTILNPAPMPKKGLSDQLLGVVDMLIPNETEMEILTGKLVTDIESFKEAAKFLHNKGIKEVLCTVGALGAFYSNQEKTVYQPAFKVKAVDTTCAGDSFIGGLLTYLSNGRSIEEAMKFASKVASIVVTKEGAQQSIPHVNTLD